ncbi:hypothetical protein [Chelativorans sp.]|uniref:hypothetical protein n=1 Tax=Chelativorans sp. TaxID=2203393 RepID=UPI002811DEA8|nr:hypothetical protein [Chelativorans sp.]
MKQHGISSQTSRRLDLHIPPENKLAAAGYRDLLILFEELGNRLDKGEVRKEELRRWEQAVIAHLHDREIDQFMRLSDDAESVPPSLPEQRWRKLRSILLARKGLSPRIC